MSFQNTKKFVADLECVAGKVKDTRIAPRGNLFITAHNAAQKDTILALSEVGDSKVRYARTATEIETKGLIFGVPLSEPEATS